MPESIRKKHFLHRGRLAQMPIYLGKQLRGFLYQNDWKVLPMSAIIAVLMSMVVKSSLFLTTEGTLIGSFALACVSVWNGTFNSIQVICRERDIVKREHRSGMHAAAYVSAHMIYQALLCLAQTVITLFVCLKCGVKFPHAGVILPHFLPELAITLFLVSYAADMVALFISAVARTTTAAMTVMPFLMIFQLIFSGGFFQLPEWGNEIAKYTISHYGLVCINAEADFNNLPSVMAWNSLAKMRSQEVKGAVTLGQVADLVSENGSSLFTEIRKTEIPQEAVFDLLLKQIPEGELRRLFGIAVNELNKDPLHITVGDVVDLISSGALVTENRDKELPFSFTVKQIMDIFGEEKIKTVLENAASQAGYNAAYERTEANIYHCWKGLALISLLFALLSAAVLKFIDKDKR